MAVRLGRVNVDEMLRSLTAKQFAEWMEYSKLEPFDETRGDYRAASIARTVANVHRGKNQQAYGLKDFLLQWEVEERQPQTWQQKKQIAHAIVAAYSVPALDE